MLFLFLSSLLLRVFFYVGYFWNVTYIYSFHKYLFTAGCQLDILEFIGINTVPAFKEFALTYVDEIYLSI